MARCLNIAAACFLLAVSPTAGSASPAQTAIRSGYAMLRQASVKNDAASLSAILASNFTQRNPDGSVEARDAYVQDETTNTPGLTVLSLDLDVHS
jgi:hypothetical protein